MAEVLASRMCIYIHDDHKAPLQSIDKHHIFVQKSKARNFLVFLNVVLLLAHTCHLFMTKPRYDVGPLGKCPVCNNGELEFTGSSYTCKSFYSKWSSCPFSMRDPPRWEEPLKLPDETKDPMVIQLFGVCAACSDCWVLGFAQDLNCLWNLVRLGSKSKHLQLLKSLKHHIYYMLYFMLTRLCAKRMQMVSFSDGLVLIT